MNIFLISTESQPFSKKGGLGDAVYGLASQLAQRNDIRIAIPFYRGMLEKQEREEIVTDFEVPLGSYSRLARIYKIPGRPSFYFIQHDFYFARNDIYGYLDDYERFTFFSRACLAMLTDETFQKRENWFPDIIHGFNAITGLMPGWLPLYTDKKPDFARSRFILTIHNPNIRGIYTSRALHVANQDDQGIHPDLGENQDTVNFLGRGIRFADRVVVSARDYLINDLLADDKSGVKEELLLRKNAGTLAEIPNAINYREYNPLLDESLKFTFDQNTLEDRVGNKEYLQEKFGFNVDPRVPLIGMVGRLLHARGFSLLSKVKEELLDSGNIQMIILAERGDISYEEMIKEWEADWKKRNWDGKTPWFKILYEFNQPLSNQIYAGCDMLLIPSKDAASTTQQLIAMHYGAVPVVHNVGMLQRTVVDFQMKNIGDFAQQGMGVGFCFTDFTPDSFCVGIKRALEVYRGFSGLWQDIQDHNLRQDFSWYSSARQYQKLYEDALSSPAAARSSMVALQEKEVEHSDENRNARLVQAILEIDSLPGIALRKVHDILIQAARQVRETLDGDAVYMWVSRNELPSILNTSPIDLNPRVLSQENGHPYQIQELHLIEESLANREQRILPNVSEVIQQINSGLAYTFREQAIELATIGSVCRIQNIAASQELSAQNWMSGLSTPITAHGRVLGRIDVLFKQPSTNGWTAYALTALSNSLGFRLETIRMAIEEDQLLQMSKALISVVNLEQAILQIQDWVKRVSHADRTWILLLEAGELIDKTPRSPIGVDMEVARIALERERQNPGQEAAFYIPDFENEHVEHASLIAIPLVIDIASTGEDRLIGVLEIMCAKIDGITRDTERILKKHLAPQAAIVLHNSRQREQDDQNRVSQLGRLANSLIAGDNFKSLLNEVVLTTAQVLQAEAASLYLINEENHHLEIRAAVGQHVPLLEREAWYDMQEIDGATAWIAGEGQTVRARSVEELHEKTQGHYREKYREVTGTLLPIAFLGIPLTVESGPQKKVLGILKLEIFEPQQPRLKREFSDEDEHLGQMMANVIAVVIQNTRNSDSRLSELITNLNSLSEVLVGSPDVNRLLQNIVDKIGEVLKVDAASLYLAGRNEAGDDTLVIAAAYGYQKPLLDHKEKVVYKFGQGVTGRIAQTGQIITNTLAELRSAGGGVTKGSFDGLHKDQKVPESFYGLPLIVAGLEKPIGVLKVESLQENFFAAKQPLLTMMASVIATVVYNANVNAKVLEEFLSNLGTVSQALVSSQDLGTLLQAIVDKVGQVLKVDAASLFLSNQDYTLLEIRAAYGYQRSLLDHKDEVKYHWGQSVTGRIADKKEAVLADTLAELRSAGGGATKGSFDILHKDRQVPESFYGVPLLVEGQEKAIGVLKVESKKKYFFANKDRQLIQMMANVIATVVYITQVSRGRLETFGSNLAALSGALVGQHDMSGLLHKVVETIREVLNAKASSLYLIDDATKKLVIQAADGYQKVLEERHATYNLGEGITGTIAKEGALVSAKTLAELHDSPGWEGKMNRDQGQEPESFLGVPLTITELGAGDLRGARKRTIGVLKVEDIQVTASHKEPFFTEQDILLVQMMANFIATVIENTRQGERKIGDILRSAGIASHPIPDMSSELLSTSARSTDAGILDQLAISIAEALEREPDQSLVEAQALFGLNADVGLYGRIANRAHVGSRVQREFNLLYDLLGARRYTDWEQVRRDAMPWLEMMACAGQPDAFKEAVWKLMDWIAVSIGVTVDRPIVEPGSVLCGSVLNTKDIFGEEIDRIPLLLQVGGKLEVTVAECLQAVASEEMGHFYSVLVLVQWESNSSLRQIRELQRKLRKDNVDVVVLSRAQMLHIMAEIKVEERKENFHRSVLQQVTTTSPFVSRGPVPDSMFFGRDAEMHTLLDKTRVKDYAIVGNRKIGKTSLLRRVNAGMQARQMIFRPVWIDCQKVKDTQGFLREFQKEMQRNPITKMLADLPYTQLDDFSEAMISISEKKGGKESDQHSIPILLMDEVDELVAYDRDNGEELSTTWRALSQRGACHFIFCGSSEIARQMHNRRSVFFNFCEEMPLGYLDPEIARRVITEPMELVGITLKESNTMLDHILSLTSGHPNLIQYIGKSLAAVALQREDRSVSTQDLKDLQDSDRFIMDYRDIMFGAAGPLEILITLVASEPSFTASHIKAALSENSVKVTGVEDKPSFWLQLEKDGQESVIMVNQQAFDTSLSVLCDYSILVREKGRYRFISATFREMLAESDVVGEIQYCKSELRKLADKLAKK